MTPPRRRQRHLRAAEAAGRSDIADTSCSGQAVAPRGADRGLEHGHRAGGVQPHLLPLADRVVAPTTTAGPAGHDVTLFGLPHGQPAAIAAGLPESTVIIDPGADFRLTEPNA